VELKRRALWPWLVGIPLAIAGTFFAIYRWRQSKDREEYEREFPVANRGDDADVIGRAAKRWNARAVIAGVGEPPKLETVKLDDAPCDAPFDRIMEFDVGEVDSAKSSIAYLFETVKRGRYRDELDRERTLRQIASPILVVAVGDRAAPTMQDGKTFEAGYRTGAAFMFDIDGTLRCAGTFGAESSDVVDYRYWKSDDPRLNSDPALAAKRAVAGDLEQQTRKAIAASLRRVSR
jgi:hypothetical protein